MFLFLQNWRTTLIPAITIPVSLIGTFAFVKLFGFSINTLTLFGITLATGLVVDDAIVVIENIERHIHEHHRPPREAASEAMSEVTSAVIATALVLAAVFVPVAFFPGTTGRLYQQFALTIAVVDGDLRVQRADADAGAGGVLLAKTEKPKGVFFRVVNRVIDGGTSAHGVGAARPDPVRGRWSRSSSCCCSARPTGSTRACRPASCPTRIRATSSSSCRRRQGASLDYTMNIVKQIEQIVAKMPEHRPMFAVGGFSFAGSAPNQGILFGS